MLLQSHPSFRGRKSREARIDAVYLLYTLHHTQSLKKPCSISVKIVPNDYINSKELVDTCLKEGLVNHAYYFYD